MLMSRSCISHNYCVKIIIILIYDKFKDVSIITKTPIIIFVLNTILLIFVIIYDHDVPPQKSPLCATS